MKKARLQGFAGGVLLTLLTLALVGTALAAGRTITIDDGITVTINGAKFSPRNVKGEEVPLFSYDGTTYAPVRALCEAAGLEVEYDADKGIARIITQDLALAADPNAARYITADRARELALAHAQVAAGEAVFLKTKLDREDGHCVYEVEFYCGDTEYDCELDTLTGQVLKFGHELECYDIHYAHQGSHHKDHHDDHASAGVTAADLIGEGEARAIALKQAPQGTQVVKCKLDFDDGRYVYEVELRKDLVEYECDVHAVTGVILDWDVDYD